MITSQESPYSQTGNGLNLSPVLSADRFTAVLEEAERKLRDHRSKSYRKWWQQVIFGVCLCLFIFPCCVFYSSVNTLSNRIKAYYNDQNIIANAYTIYSVESIFTAPFTGVLCDLFTCAPILLFHELLITLGALLCCLAKTRVLFLIGRAGYSEAMLCIQGKLIIKYINPTYQALMYGIVYASYMLGDSTASFIAYIPDEGIESLHKCYWIIFGCLLAGICFATPFIVLEFVDFNEIKRLKKLVKDHRKSLAAAKKDEKMEEDNEEKYEYGNSLANDKIKEKDDKESRNLQHVCSSNENNNETLLGVNGIDVGRTIDATIEVSASGSAMRLPDNTAVTNDVQVARVIKNGVESQTIVEANSKIEDNNNNNNDSSDTKDNSANARNNNGCKTFCFSILHFPAAYWCALIARCLFMGSKSTYDAGSVQVLQSYFGVSELTANNCFMTQQIVSAVTFPIASVLSDFDVFRLTVWRKLPDKKKSKITLIYVLLIGYILFFASQLAIVLILKNGGENNAGADTKNEAGAYAVSAVIGVGMGFFASNSTTMLAQIVGKNAAATAIGLSFAVQFIYMACYLEITNVIKKDHGNLTLSIVYTAILGVGLIMMVVIVVMWKKLSMPSATVVHRDKKAKRSQ